MGDIALFLDLDNFAIGAKHANLNFDIDLLLNYLEETLEGRVVLRRAYGDSRQNNKLLRQLATAGFIIQTAVDVSGYGKNLADMQIVVDAISTLLANQPYDIYVLITGDRDFTPLVQCLRQHGKQVIGIGVKHTASYSLAHLCDDYLYYKDITTFVQQPALHVRDLLIHVLDELLHDTNRIQASVVKQRLNDLSNNRFDHSQHTDGNFTQFLKGYPDLIDIYHEDTTTYVCRPQTAPTETLLHEKYRTGLKKMRLRVVLAADLRIKVIKDMIKILEKNEEMEWRELQSSLADYYAKQNDVEVSKNAINDVLLLSRKAQVIRTAKAASLAMAPVSLQINSSKLVRGAVVQCDAVYLQAIQSLEERFDIEEAALALYESTEYVPYLQVILQKIEHGFMKVD
ncbi:MAG: NYN domain-containing protein [Ardenticatenaceae bacterium]|nr:NYN domain-containing protein [Ardenticatenaceae bacterium]